MEEKNKIEVYINEQTKEEQIKTPMLDYATNDKGYMEYITRIFEQPIQIGEVLLDFIQRDLKENSYMIFRFYGFQTLLSKEERNNLLATDINNSDSMKRKMEQLYVKYMGKFKDYKKQIIDIIEFCLFNENAEMKDLTPLERLVVFTSTKDIKEYTILKYNNFKQSIRLNKDMSRMKEEQIINTLQDKDNTVFYVDSSVEGDFNLTIKYAANNDTAEAFNLIVNDASPVKFDLVKTGGWTTYKDANMVKISLKKGINSISIDYVKGGYNLESITISPDAE